MPDDAEWVLCNILADRDLTIGNAGIDGVADIDESVLRRERDS